MNNYRLFLEQPAVDAYTTFFGLADTEPPRLLLGEVSMEAIFNMELLKNNVAWLLNQQSLIQYNLDAPIDTSLKYYSLITVFVSLAIPLACIIRK